VFRLAALSIALTVAAGPSATLLCRTWCDPQAAATRCHEDAFTSPSVVADDGCDKLVLSSAAFVREDVRRRGVSSSGGEHAIPVPRYQLARLTTDESLGHKPGRDWSLEKQPLETALRI
jgi:hypothetical protein